MAEASVRRKFYKQSYIDKSRRSVDFDLTHAVASIRVLLCEQRIMHSTVN
jgi:cation diffusion facilitator CzcD-associated flavoprotein CzcO